MTLRLNGSTSGYTEIDAPAVAGSNTIVLPSGNGSANQLLKNGSTAGSLEFSSSVYIDSSQRLLVGTSTSRQVNSAIAALQLQIEGSTYQSSSLSLVTNQNETVGSFIVLGKSRGTSLNSSTIVSSGDSLGAFWFCGADGTDLKRGATIQAEVDGTPGANDMPGRLVFTTTADGASSPTERMRIGNNGNVGIGDYASDTRLYVKAASSGYGAIFADSSGNTLFFTQVNGRIGTGTQSSSPYNNTVVNAANAHIGSDGVLYRSTSSARFKTDVETLEDQYADALLNCRPVWYRSIAPGDSQHPDWGHWGFIAEEVGEIDPRLVFWKTHEVQKDEDGNDIQVELEEPIAEGVQYDRFVPHLLNLIKRQGEAIAELQAEVAALKGA